MDRVFPPADRGAALPASIPTPKHATTPQATQSPAVNAARDLVIWVPPQFYPHTDHPAGQIFNRRLRAYQAENPQVNIQVRIKSASGPGGLLESLTNASAVAPDSLPAVVLLTRADMIQAVSKNLLEPIDPFSAVIDEEDWFPFAQELAIQQGITYGLPFASNLLGVVYRPPELENDQPDWGEINRSFNQLIFPAGDPEALITLSLYLSTGGEIRDAQAHQIVDPDVLAQVLEVYAEGARRGLFSSVLTELPGDEQAWDLFINSESDAIITWGNRVFSDMEGLRLAMLPSLGENNYTIATGWLWCLAAGNPADHDQAIKLAEFLVAAEFLEEWSPASGFFPVRPSSLRGWSESALKGTAVHMLQSAQPRPVRLFTSIITPELKNSVAEILLRQSTPAESAQKLIERLEVIETQ